MLLSLFSSLLLHAQEPWTPTVADSVTYQLYLNQDWSGLLRTGSSILQQGIDFKYLRQRLGYAQYQRRDFYASMKQYEAALRMDPSDQVSLTYLYYAGLETGNTDYARFMAGRFSSENKTYFHQTAIRPLSGADMEYSYQWNGEAYRGNAHYKRLGISTDLGYSLHLYQTCSTFDQSATAADSYNEYRSDIVQNEYFALLSKQFTANLGVDLGYHRLVTRYKTDYYDLALREVTETQDTLAYHGNLFLGGLRYKWNRLHLGLTSSYLGMEYNHVWQTGIHLGYAFPGSHNLFLNNSLWLMQDDDARWWVSKSSLGLLLGRKCWVEAYQTFGKLDNFADLNGLYVYNSFDPTLRRTSLSLFWYATTHLTFFGNFTDETKQNSYLLRTYHQESFTTGILWKL